MLSGSLRDRQEITTKVAGNRVTAETTHSVIYQEINSQKTRQARRERSPNKVSVILEPMPINPLSLKGVGYSVLRFAPQQNHAVPSKRMSVFSADVSPETPDDSKQN